MKSKKSDSYNTPQWILNMFENWFDPCPISDGNLREFDGLGSSWKHKTFVNPPYSNPLPWVQKAVEENEKGKQIALLLKVDPSTRWYKLLVEVDAEILFFNRRIKFSGKTPNFASMLAILKK